MLIRISVLITLLILIKRNSKTDDLILIDVFVMITSMLTNAFWIIH